MITRTCLAVDPWLMSEEYYKRDQMLFVDDKSCGYINLYIQRRRGRDCMVVRFTTARAINDYHN